MEVKNAESSQLEYKQSNVTDYINSNVPPPQKKKEIAFASNIKEYIYE